MHIQNSRLAIIQHHNFQLFIRWLSSLAYHLPYSTVIRPYTKRRFHVTHHVGQKYFYSVTVTNLYQAVRIPPLTRLLAEYLEIHHLTSEIEELIRQHCCLSSGQLDLDCPATPYLANLYHGLEFDRFLGNWCRNYQLLVTRHRNHFIFSSQNPIGRRLKCAIRDLIMDHGFIIDQRPSRYCDRHHRPINFCGYGLDHNGKVKPAARLTTKLRGLIHRAKTRGDIPPSKINSIGRAYLKILADSNRTPTQAEQYVARTFHRWKAIFYPVA